MIFDLYKMSIEISNLELLNFIIENGDLSNKNISVEEKFRKLAKDLKNTYCLTLDVFKLLSTLRAVYEVRNKNEDWDRKRELFSLMIIQSVLGHHHIVCQFCQERLAEKA